MCIRDRQDPADDPPGSLVLQPGQIFEIGNPYLRVVGAPHFVAPSRTGLKNQTRKSRIFDTLLLFESDPVPVPITLSIGGRQYGKNLTSQTARKVNSLRVRMSSGWRYRSSITVSSRQHFKLLSIEYKARG